MPDIFIIAGNASTRKSSTIRALTGASQRTIRQVETLHGVIDIFVQISSLQESNVSPQEFIDIIADHNCGYVLLSLWVTNPQNINQQPDSLTYIQEFQNVGWNIRGIVVLGDASLPYVLPQNIPIPTFIPNSRNLPNNAIASQIRHAWQWL